MANFVRYIKAVGLHKRFDIEQEFHPGVNIIYGKNGTGKTTLLHILANVLNGDFGRFAFIPFEFIEVHLDNNEIIKLRQYSENDAKLIEVHVNDRKLEPISTEDLDQEAALLRYVSSGGENIPKHPSFDVKPILSTAYFPAFRTLIEASSNEERSAVRYRRPGEKITSTDATQFARNLFGEFVPSVTYPSPMDVSRRLANEVQRALNAVANTDRKLLSKAFLEIFASLSFKNNSIEDNPEHILEDIKDLFIRLENSSIITDPSSDEEVYTKLRELVPSFQVRQGKEEVYGPILDVYKKNLEERANTQEDRFKTIKNYLESVNRFLEGKELVIRKKNDSPLPIVQIKFQETDSYGQIRTLSSGERQIITLLYATTHMSGQKVVLVDEPEISLHIDWQSLLIPEMVSQLQDRQIITCTHSPMIGSEYEDQTMELRAYPTNNEITHEEDSLEDNEENL